MDQIRAIYESPWFLWMIIAIEFVIILWLMFVRKPSGGGPQS